MRVAPHSRSPFALLFPAAAIAGFGVGLALLAALAPMPPVAPLPAVMPQGANAAVIVAVEPRAWPALFGTPEAAPAEPLPPPPEIEAEDIPEPWDDTAVALRGIVAQDEGGMALIETEEGTVWMHEGDSLPDGAVLVSVLANAVEIEFDREIYLLEFDTRTAPLSVPRPGQPPAGSLDVPSFSGYVPGGQREGGVAREQFGSDR